MVKTLGMARKVDDLGRIVLPVELRRLFDIKPGDELEISVDEGAVLLRKIEARCVFCEGANNLTIFRGKQVCVGCAADQSATTRSQSRKSGAAGFAPPLAS